MNLLIHQFLKDLRMLRIPLAVWLATLALNAGLLLISFSVKSDDLRWQLAGSIIGIMLPLVLALITAVLVPLLIHAEPQVGTTAFWFTRPLSGGMLLVTKGAFLFLFLILAPLACEALVFAVSGMGSRALLLAVPEIILTQSALVLTVAVLAVVTPNFARYAAVGAVMLVFVYMLSAALAFSAYWGANAQDTMGKMLNTGLVASQQIAGGVLTVILGLVAVFNQYFTRKSKITWALLVPLMLVGVLIANFWTINLFKAVLHTAEQKEIIGDDWTLDIQTKHINVSDEFRFVSKEEKNKELRATFEVINTPAGITLNLREINASLKIPSQPLIESKMPTLSGIHGNRIWAERDFETVLSGASLLNADRNQFNYERFFRVASSVYNQFGTTPGVLKGIYKMNALKLEMLHEMSIQPGQRWNSEGRRMEITDVLNLNNGCEVVARNTRVKLLFAPTTMNAVVGNLDMGSQKEIYVLLNRERQEAVLADEDHIIGMNMQSPGRIQNQPLRLSFTGKHRYNQQRILPKLDEAWLAKASLVILAAREIGSFERPFQIDNFVMDSKKQPGLSTISVGGKDGKSREILKALSLPADPDRVKIREYIINVLAVEQNLQGGNDRELIISKLTAVGPKNLDLILEVGADNWTVSKAVDRLITAEHKDIIFKYLPDNQRLAKYVHRFGWAKDAKAILLDGLRDNPERLNTDWIKAVITLNDPSTYPQLKEWFVVNNSRMQVYSMLAALKGFDLSNAVKEGWMQARLAEDHELVRMLPVALEAGFDNAVTDAFELLEDPVHGKKVRELLLPHLPITGDNAALHEWNRATMGKRVFDPATKKFEVNSKN